MRRFAGNELKRSTSASSSVAPVGRLVKCPSPSRKKISFCCGSKRSSPASCISSTRLRRRDQVSTSNSAERSACTEPRTTSTRIISAGSSASAAYSRLRSSIASGMVSAKASQAKSRET